MWLYGFSKASMEETMCIELLALEYFIELFTVVRGGKEGWEFKWE